MFGDWINNVDSLAKEFDAAEPFPVLVIDNFLDNEVAEALLQEFPLPDRMPKSRDYMFGDKRELSSVERQGPVSKELYDSLMSEEFRTFISQLTKRELFVDPAFHGGGFHQSGNGGYLDTHVDFNMHPEHDDWLRTLNILLYMNKDWRPEYDGRLLIRNSPTAKPRAIEPIFNRGVFMLTNDSTYHGFERMTLPEGVTRKSIATYAYESVEVGSIKARTTGWAPVGGGPMKRAIARHYDALVRTKTRFLGSATSKNR